MNGPEHYKRAEELVDKARVAATFQGCDNLARAAQVHATLAHVAAVIEGTAHDEAWESAVYGGVTS